MATLVDTSGIVRFEGTITGAGGPPPVACLLNSSMGVLDIANTTVAFITYDTAYDNPVDMNALPGLPVDIGLSGLGTDTLTTTEAGVWAFSLGDLTFRPDATWTGDVNFGNLGGGGPSFFSMPTPTTGTANAREISLCQVLPLPAGAGVSVGIATFDAPTANPYTVQVGTLTIVRLA